VGFLLEYKARRLYIAGDTSVSEDIIETLKAVSPIDSGLLPVNERNYFRDQRGILGNMSVREAFLFAEELGLSKVIPVHWDMFEANSVSLDEIKAVYKHVSPRAELVINPTEI
jgi:L-ascorbate metabolism protein UlaG (beta-lactamase superfamily)